jgi:hypothetical protein
VRERTGAPEEHHYQVLHLFGTALARYCTCSVLHLLGGLPAACRRAIRTDRRFPYLTGSSSSPVLSGLVPRFDVGDYNHAY